MRALSRVRVTGPLRSQVAGYRRELDRRGYSLWGAFFHLQLVAHLSRWLLEKGIEPAEFDQYRVEQFLADRRAVGYARFVSPRGLTPLLEYLRRQGVVPDKIPAVPATWRETLLGEFTVYLLNERGLAKPTIGAYRRVAQTFLESCTCASNRVGLDQLGGAEVNAFLLTECARRSVGSANNVVVGLRALLRFLYLHGYIAAPLAEAVPWVASWRDGGRTQALQARHVAALLASCDRRCSAGRRDFAILTVLSRLGVRAAEVASLTLNDFDWRAGEVVVSGKGARRDRLPLPTDVGEAVVDYCRRGRPRNRGHELFLHVRAPYTALSSSAVSHVVLRASSRAGIAPVRAHQLRHSTASAMRRAGAPLFEIGQILRHCHLTTTAAYAKDDFDALAQIARPWPGDQP